MAVTPTPVGPLAPGPTPLVFGSVAFNSQECPSTLPIGHGELKKAVSELIGGGRVVQTFGAQPQPVTFSGTFWNVNIIPRVTLLRSYLVAGSEQLLTWSFERYYGILTKFEPVDMGATRCEYTLTIEITRDANGAFSSTKQTSVDTQVVALQNDATIAYGKLVASDATTTAWQPQWANVQQSLQQGQPLSQASPTTATNIANSVSSLTSLVTPYIAALSPLSPNIGTATQFLNALTLISRNVQGGQAPRTIQVQGGSLAIIAAKYYGDVSLASQIALANGLSTTRLPNGVLKTIILPPFPQAA